MSVGLGSSHGFEASTLAGSSSSSLGSWYLAELWLRLWELLRVLACFMIRRVAYLDHAKERKSLWLQDVDD